MAYFSDEQIWTSGQVSEVKCFNNQGQLKETFRTKTRQQPSDIGVTKEGRLAYCDEWGTVNIVREGIGEEVIKLLDWSPINLCVASNDDLLIMMYSHDFTYTQNLKWYRSYSVIQRANLYILKMSLQSTFVKMVIKMSVCQTVML